MYRSAAILHHLGHRSVAGAGYNLADNCARIFIAWVVVRDDCAIRHRRGYGAHLAALALVTVATATEHTPKLPAAMLFDSFQGLV